MSNISDNTVADENYTLAPWTEPYTKNQNKFFMVVVYEGVREGQHKFETKFIPDGNELLFLMLSDNVAIERIYVVSLPEVGEEQVHMDYIDELWVGALNQKSNKTGMAYVAITKNNTEHIFTRFGEVAASHIRNKTLVFSSAVNE